MTEKRFEEYDNGFEDKIKNEYFETNKEIVDRLNALCEENQKLKAFIKRRDRMTENKRFTLTFDDKIVDNKLNITHDVHSGYTVASNFAKMLNEFDKENEELKKENKKLICIMKQLEAKYEDKGFSLAYDMEECE